MSRKILITGCCGTTGTSLVNYILDNTDDVIYGVDNFYKEGSQDNLEEIMKNPNAKNRFFFNEKDIISEAFYADLQIEHSSGKFDQIYNLAAIVETPRFYDSPYETYSVNCKGAIELFEWAAANGVAKFVNASSSEIYGHSALFPTKENTASCYEGVEVSTRWSYAHGKILTEYVMNQLASLATSSIKVCHLRFANVYGEHDISPIHVIPYFLTKIINNEDIHMNADPDNFYRTFLHNDDSTLGTYLAMENMVNTHPYNIGSAEEVSISDLLSKCLEICEELTGEEYSGSIYQDIVRKGDPKKRWLDTTRAKDELGFECKVSLEEGIRRTAERIINEKKGAVD